MNAIEMKGITKRYERFELKDLNLSVPEGMILGLVGENGAGKTTAIRILLQMTRPDEGSVQVMGVQMPVKNPSWKEDVGIVLEEAGFPWSFRLADIDRMMKDIYRSWDSAYFFDLADRLKVPKETNYHQMSRGNAMKTGILCALSHHPKLLVLDEATSGLDPLVRDDLLDILMDFTRDEHHSVLLSSHIVSDLEKACDMIAFLHEGKLLLQEEKDVLREKYCRVSVTKEELDAIDPADILGSRTGKYGTEVLMCREKAPSRGESLSIEDLFIFMVKGEHR